VIVGRIKVGLGRQLRAFHHAKELGANMQVAPPNNLSPQLQSLGSAALGKYQSGQDFNFLLDAASTSAGGNGQSSTAAGNSFVMSGSFRPTSLVAVGTIGPGGTLKPFSPEQVQNEEAAVNQESASAYADALQNFLTLSQASGQMGTTTLSDHQEFTADDGLISGSFDTSFSLKPE
jgi:hypothetical protein